MTRGWAASLAAASLALLPVASGCDALSVNQFNGAIFQMRLGGATPFTGADAGKHLELWVRNGNDDIIRIKPYTNEAKYAASYGMMIVLAVDPNSPCMIDDKGYLLTDPAGYTNGKGATSSSVPQTPEQQAESVKLRIAQLNPNANEDNGNLYAVVPYDTTPPPAIPTNDPAARLATCQALRTTAPNYYVGNPLEVTAPLFGTVYGFITFQTLSPPADYDGFRIDEPDHIDNPQEVFMTIEGDTVDPLNRGPVYVYSKAVPGGRDIPQFSLFAGMNGGPSGNVAIENSLNTDPVQF